MSLAEELSPEERIRELEEELSRIRASRDYLGQFFESLNQRADFIEDLTACNSVEEIAAAGLQLMDRIIESRHQFFLIFNHQDNSYEPVMVSSTSDSCIDCVITEREMLDWVIGQRKPVVFPVEEDGLLDRGIRTIVYLPLVTSIAPVGLYILFSEKREDDFELQKNSLLQLFMAQVTVAIENYRLIDSVSEMRDFMRDVMENMINGIITIDTEKKVTFINRNAQFMLRLSGTEVLYRSYVETFPLDLVNILEKVISGTQESGCIIDYEFEQPISEGTTLPLGISASILNDRNNNPTGYILTIRDLTLTREVLKLKELDELKNDLISKVSHELRTPLTSISSYTDALLDGLAETKEEADSYLNIIKLESKRLIGLVNDFLDLSKMEAGKMIFSFADLHLNDIIFSSISPILPAAQEKAQTLIFEPQNDLVVRADMDKIIQVLVNLMSNAVKFTPEGGQIEIQVTDQKSKVRVAIRDNGIGMEREEVERIFDKFYQIENIRNHHKGTGLGMSICRELVINHGGKIWVTSEKGAGTTVFFTLPQVRSD